MQGKQVHGLNQHLNTIHSKTKYTLEIKQNNTINFLDLIITIKYKKKLKIYRESISIVTRI